jgi:hypothetical protein
LGIFLTAVPDRPLPEGEESAPFVSDGLTKNVRPPPLRAGKNNARLA